MTNSLSLSLSLCFLPFLVCGRPDETSLLTQFPALTSAFDTVQPFYLLAIILCFVSLTILLSSALPGVDNESEFYFALFEYVTIAMTTLLFCFPTIAMGIATLKSAATPSKNNSTPLLHASESTTTRETVEMAKTAAAQAMQYAKNYCHIVQTTPTPTQQRNQYYPRFTLYRQLPAEL